MAIKANFSEGQDSIILPSLHQWDYGQQIEIESQDIPSSIIEVHFACQSMNEAVVHPCTVIDGKGTVSIPNQCLEQSSPITAWIYEIEKVDGVITKCTTTKSMTIPVIARKRPARGEDIPQDVSDTYIELIENVNEMIGALESGGVSPSKAAYAEKAKYAESAGTATNALYATSASRANIVVPSGELSNTDRSFTVTETGVYVLIYMRQGISGYYSTIFAVPSLDEGQNILISYGSNTYSNEVTDGEYAINDTDEFRIRGLFKIATL